MSPKKIEVGSWEVLTKGSDVLILAVGSMVKKSIEVHSMLLAQNISSEVVNCRFIKPMDKNYLNESFPNHKLVVTIEEGVTTGGFGEGIVNWSNENNISNSVMTIGVPNRFVDHGPRNILLEEIGLDSMTLFEKIYNFSRKSNE